MRNGNRLYTYNQSLDKTQFEVRMPKIYNDKIVNITEKEGTPHPSAPRIRPGR